MNTELARVNRTLRMISTCNQVIVRAADEQELVQTACLIVNDIGGYPMAWIGLPENDSSKTIRPVACVGFESHLLEAMKHSWADDERGRSPTGTALRTGQVCLGHDFLKDAELASWREQALQHGFRSCIALPLLSHGRPLGVLTLYAAQPCAFDLQEIWLLRELADDLAYGMETLRIHRERDRTLQKMEIQAGQLRLLALEMTDSEQSERRRVARFLHEDLQQLLVGARFQVESLLQQGPAPTIESQLKSLNDTLYEAIDSCKSLSQEIVPPVLYAAGHGLGPALEWLGRWIHKKHGFLVQVYAQLNQSVPHESISVFFYQAARELLFNAVKHSGTQSAQLILSASSAGQLQMIVQDQGKGFDPEPIKAPKVPGAGLGLIKIQERAELLGGSLEVDSALGHGCRILLSVPLVHPDPTRGEFPPPQPEGAQKLPETETGQPTGHKIRVLLADDHALLRQGLAGVLQSQPDLEVVGEAADGLEAVELATHLQPDVVIMDMGMPRLSGIEATRRITAASPHIRVIGLSVYAAAELSESLRRAGAVTSLNKASPPKELLGAIRQAVEKNQ